jgi:hypothetical protein
MLVSLCLQVLEYLLTCKGVKPRSVITFLNQTSIKLYLKDDVHNLYAAIKRQKLLGLPPTDALLADLKARDIHYEKKVNKDNRVDHLFIAYPKSIELARTNQDIILADCTYKTNKYELPLLHIMGNVVLLCYKCECCLQVVYRS